jgi:glycosidase
MFDWPEHPAIYEINTWVWLHELSQRYSRQVTLADVPAPEWDAVAEYGFDAVWLMGVWERSPHGTQIAREHPDLQAEYHHALADYTPDDVVGSPFAVHRYVADAYLGGPEGLSAARQALAARDMRLILDFVPNHVAIDHPWTIEHPEYFVQGTAEDLAATPDAYFRAGDHILARGRDPYFPPWTDTAQLNAFSPALRKTVIDTLIDIGNQADGVRVDMAMLMVKRIFAGTWGASAGDPLAQEFWWEVINAVRNTHPGMMFMGEVYWDMEWELQQQGFNFCYDKRLYDRLAHRQPGAVHKHLKASTEYQSRLVRFIENHDEPRAAAAFHRKQERTAAMLIGSLPGARLFHEGQFEGRQVKLPVQLRRRPFEPINSELRAFYRSMMSEITAPVMHKGEWQLCERQGWPDNTTYRNISAWCWQYGDERRLIVVNLADHESQAMIRLPWNNLRGDAWTLFDPLHGDVFVRSGAEMLDSGLFVDLPACGIHFLKVTRA